MYGKTNGQKLVFLRGKNAALNIFLILAPYSFRDGFAIHKYNVTRVPNQNPDTFPDIAGLEKLEEIIQVKLF